VKKSPCQSNTDFEKIHRNSSLKIKTGNIELLPVIPFLFLDDGKGFRIVQNGSRQKT